MNLSDVVVDYGSVVRAYSRAYRELDDRFGGYDVEKFNEEVGLLKSSCATLMTSCQGDEVEGVEVVPHTYDGADALIVVTLGHKFVLLAEDASSPVYSVVNIFAR